MSETNQWHAVKTVASLIREGDAKGMPALQWTIHTPDHRGEATVVGTVTGDNTDLLLDPDEARVMFGLWARFTQARVLPEVTLQTVGPEPYPPAIRLEAVVLEQAGGHGVTVRIVADLVDVFADIDLPAST